MKHLRPLCFGLHRCSHCEQSFAAAMDETGHYRYLVWVDDKEFMYCSEECAEKGSTSELPVVELMPPDRSELN